MEKEKVQARPTLGHRRQLPDGNSSTQQVDSALGKGSAIYLSGAWRECSRDGDVAAHNLGTMELRSALRQVIEKGNSDEGIVSPRRPREGA